jgi:hypothetical protein
MRVKAKARKKRKLKLESFIIIELHLVPSVPQGRLQKPKKKTNPNSSLGLISNRT